MNSSTSNIDLSQFANLELSCSCGHTHRVPISYIYTGPGALNSLSVILEKFTGKNVFLIGDSHTYPLAEKPVHEMLEKASCQVRSYVFQYHGPTHQVLDERLIGRLMVELPKETDLILTIGSGTMNDLSRVISTRCRIPYVIIGTAPSMDGYASATSAILVDQDKISVPLQPPYGIICDTNLMLTAPEIMYASGFTDVLGKYIAIRDWILAERETGEYFCPYISDLVLSAVKKCMSCADRLFDRSNEVLHPLVDALVLAGVAIAMYGTSRPAAGGEHRIAHCWEVDDVLAGTNHFLHGNYVGFGALVGTRAYEMASEEFDLPSLPDAPTSSEIKEILDQVRGYSSLENLKISRDRFIHSLEHGANAPDRYNLFTFLMEHNRLEVYIERLTKEFYGY